MTVAAMLFGVITWALRYIDQLKEKHRAENQARNERKLEQLEAENKMLMERLRVDELATTKLEGEIRLLRSQHDHLVLAIDGIRENIVPRQEWEARMTGMEKQLTEIARKLSVGSMARTEPAHR